MCSGSMHGRMHAMHAAMRADATHCSMHGEIGGGSGRSEWRRVLLRRLLPHDLLRRTLLSTLCVFCVLRLHHVSWRSVRCGDLLASVGWGGDDDARATR